jgi:hypothetical protein
VVLQNIISDSEPLETVCPDFWFLFFFLKGNFLFIVCSFAHFEFYSTYRNYFKIEFHYTNLPSW